MVTLSLNSIVYVLFACQTAASIIKYDNHALLPNKPEFMEFPKFVAGNVPSWSPGNGHSFIDLSRLEARIDCVAPSSIISSISSSKEATKCTESIMDILLFQAPPSWKDYWETNEYCCNNDQISAGVCGIEQRGRLIIPPNLPGVLSQSVNLKPYEITNLREKTLIGHHDIDKPGVYVVFFAVCDENASPIKLRGEIDSIDPYGYLPGDVFGNLPFYGSLSLIYVLIGIVWALVCAYYRNEMMSIQYWISAVLTLGMLETTSFFVYYLEWNDTGMPSVFLMLSSLVLGVTKRALSRVVVLLVALGYGIVRPTLGEEMVRVLYLGMAYFCLSLVYCLSIAIPTTVKAAGDPAYDLLSLAAFMLAGIDTTFYIWIVSSINNLLQSLAARRQGSKYLLYRNFRSVLFVSMFFTLAWAAYSITLAYKNDWRTRWTADALWELTYLAVFVAISILWGPSRNILRYAHSIELTQLENDEEYQHSNAIEMEGGGGENDNDLDNEYGGKLNDDSDPFQGTGALDTNTAIAKKA